jgi:hypothetical protein
LEFIFTEATLAHKHRVRTYATSNKDESQDAANKTELENTPITGKIKIQQ